jgi:hypothetical protein
MSAYLATRSLALAAGEEDAFIFLYYQNYRLLAASFLELCNMELTWDLHLRHLTPP